jgi:hypothetical protein
MEITPIFKDEFPTVLISGDRNWGATTTDQVFFEVAMNLWVATFGMPRLIIEGCARGADQAGENWAIRNDVELQHNPALWATEGKAAGSRRNHRMLDNNPSAVIAFHRNLANSRGTAHMVKIARMKGTPVWVPAPQEVE